MSDQRRVLEGVFEQEEQILAAAGAVREAGYRIVDAYIPFPVHGLDHAMGLRASRLTWVCFLCGAVGLGVALWFQFWTSAEDWPINVGGKPFNSLPAFAPIAFEITILFAALGVVAALFVRCGLRPGKVAQRPPEDRVTDDRFILVVREGGGEHHPDRLRALLDEHGAVEVRDAMEAAA